MEKGYRHEYKYQISREAAHLLRMRLPCIMERDKHAGPHGEYTIRSLYFDDFSYTAMDDKLSGIREREKYRIRYYNYNDNLIKLERKEKIDHLTRKTACTITKADALALQNCLFGGCVDTKTPLTEALRLGIEGRGLRPRVLVDYDRTPFVCRDGNTRITLDDNLRTRPYCTELFASPEAMQPAFEDGRVILEVKFDDFLPGYLHDALRDIPRVNMAISKFALCLSLT